MGHGTGVAESHTLPQVHHTWGRRADHRQSPGLLTTPLGRWPRSHGTGKTWPVTWGGPPSRLSSALPLHRRARGFSEVPLGLMDTHPQVHLEGEGGPADGDV